MLARVGPAGPAIVVAAHLDTVFPADTPLEPRRDRGRLHGPGIGDNCVAVATLIELGRHLARVRRAPRGAVLLAATVGEEGLGDLRGIRAVLDAHPASAVIALEGHGLDSVVTAGIASARYVVTYRGPGGHSWRDRDRPSALHVLFDTGRAAIAEGAPAHVNIGVVSGGLSVNSIAGEARMEIDIRAETDDVVDRACARIEHVLAARAARHRRRDRARRAPAGRQHPAGASAAARGAPRPHAGRAAAGARGRRLDRRQRGARPRHPGRHARPHAGRGDPPHRRVDRARTAGGGRRDGRSTSCTTSRASPRRVG